MQVAETTDWVALVDTPLPVAEALAWVVTPDCGATVCFLGTVRDHAEGRDGVTALTYEAYEELAVPRLEAVAAQLRHVWPAIGRIALLHRTGELALTDVAVAVVVSTAHRGAAFDAARYAIDMLKDTVPIWKHETWAGGSDWGTGGVPVQDPPGVVANVRP